MRAVQLHNPTFPLAARHLAKRSATGPDIPAAATEQTQENLDRTIAELRAFGVESIGRQGAFEYQPTARDTTLKAEAALCAEDRRSVV